MWILLPIVVYGLCWYWWWTSYKKIGGLQKQAISDEPGVRSYNLPQDDAVRYINLFANVFRTQNLASVFSVMSDIFYHKVSETIKGLNRIGIRKEIDFSPHPESNDAGQAYEYSIFQGGKAETGGSTIAGDYRERYVDSATGAVLYASEKKSGEITVGTVKSAVRTRDQAQPIYCTGCGMPIDTSGEIFICKYCGATYRSDSFDWVAANIITPMGVDLQSKTGSAARVKALMNGFIYGGLALIVLGIFAGNVTFLKILVGVGCLAMPGIILYINHATIVPLVGYKKALQYDPLASIPIVAFRMDYLMRRLYTAHDHNPGDMRSMMDERAFQAFAQLPHSGAYVLDLLGTADGKSDFYVRDRRQYFDLSYKALLLVLTPQRTATVVEKPVHVVYYRNERARYAYMLSAEATKCYGCGMPLDLTAHGACKYCGAEYDVADFDWKIAHVDAGSFV